jgi:hypothetical protein
MVACVAIGLATSLILVIALLFVSHDIDTIITSGAGPLLQIIFDATNSKVGSICLLLFVTPPIISRHYLSQLLISLCNPPVSPLGAFC